MTLTNDDIEQFISISTQAGGTLSRAEAVAAATRLALLYQQVLLKTTDEPRLTGLAKPAKGVTVDGNQNPKPYTC
jgi:hypothetical protein